MVDFASFETFNPSGPGLGNLFNPISPLEALGIWPSGDFRLDPGDGAVPAVGFYLGELLGLLALAHGLAWWLWRHERAVPIALAVAAALFAYAHFAGTPYQAAKSIVIAAPLAMLIAARALISGGAAIPLTGVRGAVARRRGGAVGVWTRWEPRLRPVLATAFLGRLRRMQPARARQRARRARDLLTRAHRAARCPRRRFHRRPRPRERACR